MAGALLLVCTLSGKWWLLGYALAGLAIFSVVLLYALYLENDAQAELERRDMLLRRSRPKPRKQM